MNNFKTMKNNEGSILIAVILILAGLSLTVFMASRDSVTGSKIVRSGREYNNNIYRSETGINLAIESHKETWLKSDSKLFDLSDNSPYIVTTDDDLEDDGDGNKILIEDSAGNPVAKVSGNIIELTDDGGSLIGDIGKVGTYEIARIEANPAAGTVSKDKFYTLPHTSHPLPGTGFSAKNFEIRRYGIISTGQEENGSEVRVETQAGLFKHFTKK